MAIRTPRPEKAFAPELRRKIELARLSLGVEGLWPLLAAPLAIVAVFVGLSWFGVFAAAPLWLRLAAAALFAAPLAWSLWRLVRFRAPDVAAGARRLDLSDPALNRPLSTLADSPAGNDPVARELWRLHTARAAAAAANVRVAPPVSHLPQRDRYALTALAALTLVAGGFVAGDERLNRLTDAFSLGLAGPPPVPPRLDAWIDPPGYTGRAPIFLTGPSGAGPGAVQVPFGSVIVVRVSPGVGVEVTADKTFRDKALTLGEDPGKKPLPGAPAAALEKRYAVEGDGAAEIRHNGRVINRFALAAIPDRAPSVEFQGLEPDEKGQSLRLRYKLDDDYGVARAEAVIERADRPGARTLLPPPEIPVGGRLGENESPLAAPEHPWAGARVSIRLKVEDDLGQSAESVRREAVIPARRFENPLSRALVEQRRNIVLAPDDRRTPTIGLDSLLAVPERFTKKSGDYIMLSMAARKMRTARTDVDLVALAQYLWDTAVALDEDGVSDAERRLRAAEERLREALERGANMDDIRKLMEDMKQALNDMMRELADRAQRDPNTDRAERSDRNQQTITRQDLQKMLERIEELYRQGDSAKAQELLRQLQEMLRNMETARRRGPSDPRQREMGDAMDELDKMMREQEQLRDETFRNQQRRRADRNQQQGQNGQQQRRQQQGQRGQQGQQGQQGEDGEGEDGEGEDGQEGKDGQGLADRQQALRDRLNQLRDKLRKGGAQDEEGLEGADEGMGDATDNLKKQQRGQAGRGQQKAIDEMGKAGRGLAEQMQRQRGEGQEMGEGEGEGEGFGPGEPGRRDRGRAQQNTDPLGRPLPGDRNQQDNSRVKIPDSGAVQGSIAERAQKVLEELRRRFGESARPREELEYIERLLRRN